MANPAFLTIAVCESDARRVHILNMFMKAFYRHFPPQARFSASIFRIHSDWLCRTCLPYRPVKPICLNGREAGGEKYEFNDSNCRGVRRMEYDGMAAKRRKKPSAASRNRRNWTAHFTDFTDKNSALCLLHCHHPCHPCHPW